MKRMTTEYVVGRVLLGEYKWQSRYRTESREVNPTSQDREAAMHEGNVGEIVAV
jgi:hypothetical protein